MNDNNLDLYFMNQHEYSKIKEKENKKEERKNRKELKFYKKRIYELIKEILDGKETNEELVDSLDIFIKKSIEHFKIIDRSDILQEEYNNISKKVKFKKELKEDETERKIEESNNLLMKSMDVKTTDIEKSLGLIRKKKECKKEIIPKQKELNIKDPKFKKNRRKEKKIKEK
jgi:hypothetical protein